MATFWSPSSSVAATATDGKSEHGVVSPILVDADAVNAPPNVEEEYRDVVADHADETATSDSSLVPAADVSDAGVDDVATLPSRCRQ